MGVGKSKLKQKKQNTSKAYRSNAGGNNGYDNRKTDNALAKTKGYDNLTANKDENRGRKKKK